MTSEVADFRRGPVTRMAYAGLAVYAFALYLQGPLLPLLREDLDFSYAMMSAHSTVFAAGGVLVNVAFERVRRRIGYRSAFWLSISAVALGAVLMAVGPVVAVTLVAAALMGVSGALLQTVTLSVLAEHHGPLRERALVEANAAASAAALAAPLAIGAMGMLGADWQTTLFIPLAAFLAVYGVFRREPFLSGRTTGAVAGTPEDVGTPGNGRAPRLPRRFWLAGVLCSVVVGLEFCLVLYGSPHLTTGVGMSSGAAGTALSLFYGGTLVGRLAGSRLSGRQGGASALTGYALALTAVSFTALWAADSPSLALPSLFFAGLGVANLFPLTLSMAVATAPEHTARATARVQLMVSAAIMVAPFLLGALSDRVGVERAFTVAAVLIGAAAALLVVTRFARAEQTVAEPSRAQPAPSMES
ncbi:MFS transporter [Streptomyces sp. NPDC059009]|uniref:MFS transporter n=1 Tax=Streptomyces sp. NPDC059009 TaxID=3346694 RepID=UPI003689E085